MLVHKQKIFNINASLTYDFLHMINDVFVSQNFVSINENLST